MGSLENRLSRPLAGASPRSSILLFTDIAYITD